MKNICIFDLDGTLIDTLDSLTLSVNLTMQELKLSDITREQCRAFVGNGARYLIEKSILNSREECNDQLLNLAIEIYQRIFAKYCMYQVVSYEGINETLDQLKGAGYRLAVLSNKPHDRTVEIIEHYYGKGYFEYIQGQCKDVPRKPDPESIRYVMNQLQTEKEQCVYIGDSEVDIMTGKEAEVTTIGVSWGFRDRNVLETMKATAIIDRPEQLLEFLHHMNEE